MPLKNSKSIGCRSCFPLDGDHVHVSARCMMWVKIDCRLLMPERRFCPEQAAPDNIGLSLIFVRALHHPGGALSGSLYKRTRIPVDPNEMPNRLHLSGGQHAFCLQAFYPSLLLLKFQNKSQACQQKNDTDREQNQVGPPFTGTPVTTNSMLNSTNSAPISPNKNAQKELMVSGGFMRSPQCFFIILPCDAALYKSRSPRPSLRSENFSLTSRYIFSILKSRENC